MIALRSSEFSGIAVGQVRLKVTLRRLSFMAPTNHLRSDGRRMWVWISCVWTGAIFFGSTAIADASAFPF